MRENEAPVVNSPSLQDPSDTERRACHQHVRFGIVIACVK